MPGLFDRVDFGRVEEIRAWPTNDGTLDLSTARAKADALDLPLAGLGLYATDRCTGSVFLRINSQDGARIPIGAGFAVEYPIARVFLDWDAQPGAVFQLVYGGARFTPRNDISQIGTVASVTNVGTVGEVTPRELGPTAYFRHSTTAALATLVTPAANVAGVRVDAAWCLSAGPVVRVMAKASAPATWDDATAHTLALARNPEGPGGGMSHFPIILPAGVGLYEQPAAATAATQVGVSYEVLS